jgi:uncharacterized membrane protein
MRRCRRWLAQGWSLVGADLPVFTLAAFITVAGSLLSAFILALPLLSGLCIMFLEKMAGRAPTLQHLWEGMSRFPAAIVIWMAYALASLPFDALHMLALSRGGPGWGLGYIVVGHVLICAPLLFCLPLIADRDTGGVEALRTSWSLVRTNVPLALVLSLVLSLMLALGAFACGLGIIVTLPVAVAALMLAYREWDSAVTTEG